MLFIYYSQDADIWRELDTDFKTKLLQILFHFSITAKKIYSAKLAESWPYRKNSLCAATVNVEYMNLDADDIIL